MIKHHGYFTGGVQSLRATNGKGLEFTVGVVEPGEYDFGIAERTEEIKVTLGCLEINGMLIFGHATLVIPAGGAIKIRATDTVAYLCCYR